MNYIDLGLPSGNLWADENVFVNGKTHFSFVEAIEEFGDELPSSESWQELFDYCKRKWDDKRKGYVLTGPNGNTLFLPVEGWQKWNEETKELNGGGVYDVGGNGRYWSSSPYGVDSARSVNFYSGYVYPQSYSYRLYGFSIRLCKNKNMSQQTINIPDGFELVQTSKTTFEIKKKQKQLPKTWEEFCQIKFLKKNEAYINTNSTIMSTSGERNAHFDRNTLPTRKDAESILALIQLIQLREYYNDSWKPDWTDNTVKSTICYWNNHIVKSINPSRSCVLVFKTEKLRDEFFENFKDLIEQAKDFI